VKEMLIEPVNGSEKWVTPLVRAELLYGIKPTTTSEESPPAEEAPDFAEMADLAIDVQANLKTMHDVALNFSVHASSGRIIVTVADEETGELIREIPSGEFLNLSAKLDEMFGILFDQNG
jgi:flagellar protein FlaG